MSNPQSHISQLRVLVVEDESLISEEIIDRLESLGCRILTVYDSGEQVVRNIDSLQPELILMDIRLKGALDGIQTAEIIRQRHAIPIIFLTSYSDLATLNRVKGTRPYGYILKPFHEKDLFVAMELAMARYHLEQAAGS